MSKTHEGTIVFVPNGKRPSFATVKKGSREYSTTGYLPDGLKLGDKVTFRLRYGISGLEAFILEILR